MTENKAVVVVITDSLEALLSPEKTDLLYLKAFDPEAQGGRGRVELTNKIKEAMVFPSVGAAFELWRTQSKTHPWRETDGKANRPLTAYHATFLDAP